MSEASRIGDLVQCKVCAVEFYKKTARHACCSVNCTHTNWVRSNQESWREYNKAWRAKNPEALEKYNAKKRIGWRKIPCQQCGKFFDKHFGQKKYCSVRCRSIRYSKTPGYREKSKKLGAKWRANNRELLRARSKTYFRVYFEKTAATQPWLYLFRGARQRAKENNVPFDLDEAWAKQRWTGRCELTDLEFSPPEKRKGNKLRNFSPSIDRIVGERGYTKDNCRFILWAVNSFKRDSSDADMYKTAVALVKNMPSIFRTD